MPGQFKSFMDRFWSKVLITNTCWEWTGSRKGGQPRFNSLGKIVLASRFMFEWWYGAILNPNIKVCHFCDNTYCIRPDHFFLGTQQDNLQDMTDKGRRRGKFTLEQIKNIKELYASGKYSQQEIANVFKCNQTAISKIINNYFDYLKC